MINVTEGKLFKTNKYIVVCLISFKAMTVNCVNQKLAFSV